MVGAMDEVYSGLYEVFVKIDQTKVVPTIGPVADGWFLQVLVSDKAFCSFRIEVTPHLFDIDVDEFAVGDVLHDCFDYRDVILAIAGGNVAVATNTCCAIFYRDQLSVYMPDGRTFSIESGLKVFRRNMAEREFSSYLL
jgi:hypothetical protein